MILQLQINNYAIIESLTVDFARGFNIITGETGAGKSILLGALGLILGNRADVSTLKNADKKCVVEGVFNAEGNTALTQLLLESEIEQEGKEIIIRREIASSGKSRAFVNDTPVTLQILKQISTTLVDLHQQFDTLELGEADFQRDVLDAIAHTNTEVQSFKKEFTEYTKLVKELQHLKEAQATAAATLDYNQYLFTELEELNLQSNELENLEEELKVLQNAESIKAGLQQSAGALVEDEQNISQQVKQVLQTVKQVAAYNKEAQPLLERLQSASIELNDVGEELAQLNDKLSVDPERIEIVTDRINIGYKLLKKHNVQTTAELLYIKDELEQKLIALNTGTDTIQQLEQKVLATQNSLQQKADQLHAKRGKAAQPLAKEITSRLVRVGMPNAQLKIEVAVAPLHQYGASEISFLFDANKSGRFEPIAKVASGGELSRLMLCIKSLVAGAVHLPVLIFDEIDTGISGEAAKQVGIIMAELAQQHQIISITHQPQIAAMAQAHYFVHKAIVNDAVTTSIKQLTKDERIVTIAQMLSGEKPTAAALENAKEMVGN